MRFIKSLIRYIALKFGKGHVFFIKFCKPGGAEYARYLKKHGRFYAVGDNCLIWPYTNIPNPEYVEIGNNVVLTACSIFGHDGVVAMLNRAYNTKLDSVGKVVIKDNVFVGHGAIILPGVTIGPNAIVGAGSVVTKDVSEGTVVGGIPADRIGKTDSLVKRMEEQTRQLPWYPVIKKREGAYDPVLEKELVRQRIQFFFKQGK